MPNDNVQSIHGVRIDQAHGMRNLLRASVSWRVEDAPEEYQPLVECAADLCSRAPLFVTFVPACLRETHTPRAAIASEQVDGGTIFIE